MLAGAVLAGRGLQNATMGVHHGLAQLVGGRTGIPHGLANAVILPHAMRLQPRGRARTRSPHRRGDRRAGRPAGAVSALSSASACRPPLGTAGSPTTTSTRSPAWPRATTTSSANPRPVTEADARAILEAAY